MISIFSEASLLIYKIILNGKISSVIQAKENFLKEEYDRHCAHFDGNLRDIMDVVIKELRSDENTIKVRHEEGEEFLQPESLLMSVFTLIVAGKTDSSQ